MAANHRQKDAGSTQNRQLASRDVALSMQAMKNRNVHADACQTMLIILI